MTLSKAEFEHLMGLEKEFQDLFSTISLGPPPMQWTREIICRDAHETFLLDYYRGSFELSKYTINHRYRQSVILLRFDNWGRHTNPDGFQFAGPHVHIYTEGYNDKFAYPISDIGVDDEDAPADVLKKVMEVCNITRYPLIDPTLF